MTDHTDMHYRFYDLDEAAYAQFHGTGKAWAAIQDDKVTCLVYMDGRGLPQVDPEVPQWVRVIKEMCAVTGDDRFVYWSTKQLINIARAMEICRDCPRHKDGKVHRPSMLVAMAGKEWQKASRRQFSDHRDRSFERLNQFGTVISGMAEDGRFSTF